ncbi:MAG: acetolactate synthase [Planctomycetaceae bacterium]|nr:acetolactate synthase [Planctomycetaceae bacterium]MCA9110558.1 acetolactate synthase [Planctomycetaceae bacterium]
MPEDFGEGTIIDPATARGQEWPCLRQFCVFMENRVGRLHQLLRHIEQHDLRVVALSLVDTVDFAVARVMVDRTDRAREIFTLSDFTFIENDVLGVILPDDPQPYVRICLALLAAEMNIHYTYPLNYRRGGNGAIAIYVEDIDQATRILEAQGMQLLHEGDLLCEDEFF